MDYAFLFDMDGVIVDSNPAHKIALQRFCRQHGYELTEDFLREKIYGRTNKDWIPNVFGKIEDARVRQYAAEKEALYRELYSDIQPLPGLIDFLKALDVDKIPRAIATSAPRANVDFTLSKTGTEKFFPVILDDTFISRSKPDPEIYLKAAAALGTDPARCVVFEDSLSGVKAGKAAGCKVVGISTTHTAAELHETDWVMPDFQGTTPAALLERLF